VQQVFEKFLVSSRNAKVIANTSPYKRGSKSDSDHQQPTSAGSNSADSPLPHPSVRATSRPKTQTTARQNRTNYRHFPLPQLASDYFAVLGPIPSERRPQILLIPLILSKKSYPVHPPHPAILSKNPSSKAARSHAHPPRTLPIVRHEFKNSQGLDDFAGTVWAIRVARVDQQRGYGRFISRHG
jgi:hypothetical protein